MGIDEPRAPCTTCGDPALHLHLFVATLPEGEDPASLAQRDPTRLQRIIDEAKPAGVWRSEYLAAHPEASRVRVPEWMTGEEE